MALYLEKLFRYSLNYVIKHLQLRFGRRWKVKEEDETVPMDVDSWEPTKTEEDYENEIRSLKKKLRKITEEKDELQMTVQIKKDCISSLQDELSTKKAENLSNQDFQEKQHNYQTKLEMEKEDAVRAREHALDDVDRLTMELGSTQRELARKDNELENLRGRYERLETKHATLVEDNDQARETIASSGRHLTYVNG